MPTKAAATEEATEQKASLPVNHPKAGYLGQDPDWGDREPPEEEPVDPELIKKSNLTGHGFNPADANTIPRTAAENVAKAEEDKKVVAEAEDKAATEWREAEEEAAKQAEEARQKQLGIQAKAGLVPEPTPTAAQIAQEKSS